MKNGRKTLVNKSGAPISAQTKIDHLPIVQALRKMENYQERHFPLESLDASYDTWMQIVNYIEGRERNLMMARQLGMPNASKAADILLGKAPNVNAFGEESKPLKGDS